jgi:hypothetical protein
VRRENFAQGEKYNKVRTLVVDDAHVLEAGDGAHELEIFGRISILYAWVRFRLFEMTAPYPLKDNVRGDCRVTLLARHSCAFLQGFRNETAQVWVPSVDEDFAGFV